MLPGIFVRELRCVNVVLEQANAGGLDIHSMLQMCSIMIMPTRGLRSTMEVMSGLYNITSHPARLRGASGSFKIYSDPSRVPSISSSLYPWILPLSRGREPNDGVGPGVILLVLLLEDLG